MKNMVSNTANLATRGRQRTRAKRWDHCLHWQSYPLSLIQRTALGSYHTPQNHHVPYSRSNMPHGVPSTLATLPHCKARQAFAWNICLASFRLRCRLGGGALPPVTGNGPPYSFATGRTALPSRQFRHWQVSESPGSCPGTNPGPAGRPSRATGSDRATPGPIMNRPVQTGPPGDHTRPVSHQAYLAPGQTGAHQTGGGASPHRSKAMSSAWRPTA